MIPLLLAAALETTPLIPEDARAQRLFMLSAAAAKLCLLKDVPDPYYTEELHNFFRAINEDYPGHKEWFKRERTADGAMMLSTLLNDECRFPNPKTRKFFIKQAQPYLD